MSLYASQENGYIDAEVLRSYSSLVEWQAGELLKANWMEFIIQLIFRLIISYLFHLTDAGKKLTENLKTLWSSVARTVLSSTIVATHVQSSQLYL